MPWLKKNGKCCGSKTSTSTQYTFDTLIIFGKEYNGKYSVVADDKEEYTTYAQVKTTSPHTQHYNKNFSVAPLDFDTKVIIYYTEQTKKIQNDWYVIIKNHKLRVKSVENVDKQNDYLILFLKTEQATV